MKNVFDYETEKITITGAFPLIHNRRVVDYLLVKVNNAEEERVERGESFAMAPMSYAGFVVDVAKIFYGDKPEKNQILDEIIGALNDLYDKTDVTNVLSPSEEDSFIEYLAWLKGGYTTLEGDVVPFVKPDEDGLVVAATVIDKMINARA